MILYHWTKCLDGDLRYIRKNVDEDSLENDADLTNWFKVYDSYLNKFGFNPKYLKVLKVLKTIALLELKWIITRNNFIETKISIEREKLKAMTQKSAQGISTERSLIYISKWYGSHLDINTITVSQYEEISRAFSDASKEEKARNNQRNKR